MEIKRAIVALAAIFILATGGAVYYFYQQSQTENIREIGGSGTIEAEEIKVGSLVGGKITKLAVKEGDKVKKGSLIVLLDNEVLKEQVKVAEAAVDIARAQLKKAKDDGSRVEIDIAETQLKQAQASLQAYKAQLKETEIKAPANGIILSLPVTLGEVVSAGSTIVVIGDLSQVKLVIYLSEEKAGRVKIGDKVEVKVDSYPDRIFRGQVYEIASQAEFTPQNIQTKEQRTSLVYAVTVRIDNPDLALKPGQPAEATIETK